MKVWYEGHEAEILGEIERLLAESPSAIEFYGRGGVVGWHPCPDGEKGCFIVQGGYGEDSGGSRGYHTVELFSSVVENVTAEEILGDTRQFPTTEAGRRLYEKYYLVDNPKIKARLQAGDDLIAKKIGWGEYKRIVRENP